MTTASSCKSSTILMGSGSYFDYRQPNADGMSVEDVAYALAYTARFRGQTRRLRADGQRVFYSVAEHCTRMSFMLEALGHDDLSMMGLMHESGEVVLGDLPSPAKAMLPEFKTLENACEAAINASFNVRGFDDPGKMQIIKSFDLRMLATEKRDLMVAGIRGDSWEMLADYRPFEGMVIEPSETLDTAAEAFLDRFYELRGSGRG